MKKHILLTTTAMLLSAITLNANADSNSAQLEVKAMFVKPMELISEKYLGFGMILAGEAEKTVIVTTDGKLGDGSDATMISKASYKNYGESRIAHGSFNEGVIRAKGFLDDNFDGASFITLDEEALNLLASISISDKALELKSQTDSTTCGTVTDFDTKLTIEGNDVLIHIGGKLTTADLRGASRTLQCRGYTTVTFVYNEEKIATVQNNFVNQ